MKKWFCALACFSFFCGVALADPDDVRLELRWEINKQVTHASVHSLTVFQDGRVIKNTFTAHVPERPKLMHVLDISQMAYVNKVIEEARKGEVIKYWGEKFSNPIVPLYSVNYTADNGKITLRDTIDYWGGLAINESPAAKKLVEMLDDLSRIPFPMS